MTCLAAPVVDAQQEVVAALGIPGLTLYYTQAGPESVFGPKVVRAARAASANLGASSSRKGMRCEGMLCG